MKKQRIATVSIQSEHRYSNKSRLADMNEIIRNIEADLFVFPAGYFSAGNRPAKSMYIWLEDHINCKQTVCVGVDGYIQKPWPKDQTSLTVSNNKTIACARKFYPAPVEKGLITLAGTYLCEENNWPREFYIGNKLCYMAVCYDSFGIRKQNILSHGADIAVNNIHAFYPQGSGNSGESYFARHGLAGLSRQWACPVFASAVFFDRKIPSNWPTGVYWNHGKKSTHQWSYDENPLKPIESLVMDVPEGSAKVQIFEA